MDISKIATLPQIKEFLENTQEFSLAASSKPEVYEWLNKLLIKLKYHKLRKKDKGVVKRFIRKVTGYSAVQLKRLIAKQKKGQLYWQAWQKNSFPRVYSDEDIALLHALDSAHKLAGPATKKILEREYKIFGNKEYERLKNISIGHIYNLRNSRSYLRQGTIFHKTKSHNISIGIRKKPRPNGKPGYLRVDTVHQGDKGKKKGVYFINIVDEVTQIEFVFSVPAISEKYMKEILEFLIELCPFVIVNFHSDNGSEYINKVVAELLNKAHVEQTKSRARKTNDNALAESKNGSVIRKHFGYMHIPATKRNAQLLNEFCVHWLNPYLIYHRPCGFAETKVDKRGKEKKVYKYEDYQTPYEKLKSLPNAKKYLKPGVTFNQLDKIALAHSDTEFARRMNKQKDIIFMHLQI